MPAKGTDIVKKLPESGKKNCKECGFPTCFAFAMKLASGGATLDKCPHLSSEVVAELEDALAPPMKLVTIGSGDNAIQIGNEEVVYRHDKTFVHSPGFALLISDTDSDDVADQKISKIQSLQFDRVGLTLKAELLALRFDSGDKSKFLALVKKACDKSKLGMVIISDDVDTLFEARDICADRRPLLYPITKDNIDKAIPLIKKSPTPLGIRASSVEELVPLTTKLKDEGVDELVLVACGTIEDPIILPVPAAIFSPVLRIHVAVNADYRRNRCLKTGRLLRGVGWRRYAGCFFSILA